MTASIVGRNWFNDLEAEGLIKNVFVAMNINLTNVEHNLKNVLRQYVKVSHKIRL